MLLVKHIIMIMCAKNYKNKFRFVDVIQEKVYTFFPHTVYLIVCLSVHGWSLHRSAVYSPVVHRLTCARLSFTCILAFSAMLIVVIILRSQYLY